MDVIVHMHVVQQLDRDAGKRNGNQITAGHEVVVAGIEEPGKALGSDHKEWCRFGEVYFAFFLPFSIIIHLAK